MPNLGFTPRRSGHVVLRSSDVDRAQAFLEFAGFQYVGHYAQPRNNRFVLLSSVPVSNHHMIALSPGAPEDRKPEPNRHIGLIAANYRMRDLDALHALQQHLIDGAAAFGAGFVAAEVRGSIHSLTVHDADGNYLDFFHDTADTAAPPARSAPIVSTSHFTFRCADLPASIAFHERALGLTVLADGELGRCYLGTGGKVLVALEAAADLDVPRPAPKRMLGAEHVSFELGSFEQLRTAYRHFVESGITIDHTVDHGVTKSVYFVDPDGNVLEVYHDVPRAEYREPGNPFLNYGDMLEELNHAAT